MRFVVMLVLAAGCGTSPNPSGTKDSSSLTGTQGTATLTDVSCALNAAVPTALNCTLNSSVSGTAHIETWLGDEDAASTPEGADSTEHALSAIGLLPGQTWNYRVVVTTADGTAESDVGVVETPRPPDLLPALTVVHSDPSQSEAANGFVVTAMISFQNKRATPVIIDGDGRYRWWYEIPDPSEGSPLTVTTRMSRDGKSVIFLTTDFDQDFDIGTVYRVSLDGTEVSTTRVTLGHHDFVEHADGTIAAITAEYRIIDDETWSSDKIEIFAEGDNSGTVLTKIYSWFDQYGMEPFRIDDHQNNYTFGEVAVDWTHSNSLMFIDDGHYYVMSKYFDNVIKVDLQGNVIWDLGGPFSDFTNPDGSSVWNSLSDYTLFSHAHMSHLWSDGMAVFDNGYHDLDGSELSRAVEYSWDDQAMTVEEVWAFDEPGGRFTGLPGDVRKLNNGSFLIGWGQLAYISEVTQAKEVVWQLDVPSNNGNIFNTRMVFIDDLYAPVSQ